MEKIDFQYGFYKGGELEIHKVWNEIECKKCNLNSKGVMDVEEKKLLASLWSDALGVTAV